MSAPSSRSTLRLAAAWLGLMALGTGVTVGVLMLPRAGKVLQAASSHTIDEAPDTAAVEGLSQLQSSPDGPAIAGDMEGEEVDIPVVEQPEAVDPDTELEMAPAENRGDGAVVAANEDPKIGAASIERITGPRPWVVHKMAGQETVDQVAHRYGVRPEELRNWNGIEVDTTRLKQGARVKVKARRIPPRRIELQYVVQEGDTWWSIAIRYGVDARELRAANADTPRKLVVGETLTLWIDPVVFNWVMECDAGRDTSLPYVRCGAVSIGPPQAGRLVNGVQIPAGEGYSRKMLPSSYGTTHAVTQLVSALRDFRATSEYEGEIILGSMSRRYGGPLEGHLSHQSGRDVDIRLPLRADLPPWFPLEPWRVDYGALWHLLRALEATGHVQIVFLDYELQKALYKAATELGVDEETRRTMLQWPRGEKAQLGLVRHSPGHERHFHVRFSCGELEPECASPADDDRGDAAE